MALLRLLPPRRRLPLPLPSRPWLPPAAAAGVLTLPLPMRTPSSGGSVDGAASLVSCVLLVAEASLLLPSPFIGEKEPGAHI